MNRNQAQSPQPVTIFTIGFAQKTAREFFDILRAAGVRKVIDVRLNNVSQLAGFTRKNDLAFFLEELEHIGYEHHPELAPTKDMLEDFRDGRVDWDVHVERIRRLMAERAVERALVPDNLNGACLLCSEPEPERCHRTIVAEYLRDRWGHVDIRHLPGSR